MQRNLHRRVTGTEGTEAVGVDWVRGRRRFEQGEVSGMAEGSSSWRHRMEESVDHRPQRREFQCFRRFRYNQEDEKI